MFDPGSLTPGVLMFVGFDCMIVSYDRHQEVFVTTMDALGFVVSSEVVTMLDEWANETESILCMLAGIGLYYVPIHSVICADRFDRRKHTPKGRWDGRLKVRMSA